jgi:hypothetical protein
MAWQVGLLGDRQAKEKKSSQTRIANRSTDQRVAQGLQSPFPKATEEF